MIPQKINWVYRKIEMETHTHTHTHTHIYLQKVKVLVSSVVSDSLQPYGL